MAEAGLLQRAAKTDAAAPAVAATEACRCMLSPLVSPPTGLSQAGATSRRFLTDVNDDGKNLAGEIILLTDEADLLMRMRIARQRHQHTSGPRLHLNSSSTKPEQP